MDTLISLINVEPTLTDFEKFHPPQNKILPPQNFLRLHKNWSNTGGPLLTQFFETLEKTST